MSLHELRRLGRSPRPLAAVLTAAVVISCPTLVYSSTAAPADTPANTRAEASASAAAAAAAGSTSPKSLAQVAPDRFGSVTESPRLSKGFTRTFKSRFVVANGIRQHVVIGGDGPPLLLLHGWPQNWYAWRHLMPSLARHYTVIAPDQRGIGLSEKTKRGYDVGTLADDAAALMTRLGHDRFAVVGHDTGYFIGYALAADHSDRVERIALAEVPGPPGVGDDPSLWVPEPINNKVWHIPFNRVSHPLILKLVSKAPHAFYGYEFKIQSGGATVAKYARNYYIQLYTRSRTALRASFGLYRAWDVSVAQNRERAKTPLTLPVVGIGGANSWGPFAAQALTPAAPGVQTVVIPDVGHWVAETARKPMLRTLREFLQPYRSGS